MQLPPYSQLSDGYTVMPCNTVELLICFTTFLHTIDAVGFELPLLQVKTAFFPAFAVAGSTDMETSDGLN